MTAVHSPSGLYHPHHPSVVPSTAGTPSPRVLVIVKTSGLVTKAGAKEAAPVDKASPVTASGTKLSVVAKKREEVQ